jgi:hypothetical protein
MHLRLKAQRSESRCRSLCSYNDYCIVKTHHTTVIGMPLYDSAASISLTPSRSGTLFSCDSTAGPMLLCIATHAYTNESDAKSVRLSWRDAQ